MKTLTLPSALSAALLLATAVSAQDYTHPRDMAMPATGFERPDPMQYQVKLDNGLIGYVVEDNLVPLVTLRAYVKMGKISDDKEGTAEVIAHALKTSGTSAVNGEAFHKELWSMTADYRVALHNEWMEISLNVPKDDLDEAMSLFTGLLTSPAITQASIDAMAKGAKAASAATESGSIYDGSMNVAVAKFHDVLYAGHPYGYKPTSKEYKSLKLREVKAFHEAYFSPSNMTIAVGGAIDPDAVYKALANTLGSIAASTPPAVKTVPPLQDKAAANHHFAADKYLTWAVIGHTLPKVPVEEQAALEVMNYILGGGHFWTRMFLETRDKYGLTNDASGYFAPHWYGPGSYSYHASSRHDVFKILHTNVVREAVNMSKNSITDDEMLVAKNALADGTYENEFKNGETTASTFAKEMLRNGNHNLSASYPARIRAVTKQDVLNAAKKYIRPDQFQTVMVGKAGLLD